VEEAQASTRDRELARTRTGVKETAGYLARGTDDELHFVAAPKSDADVTAEATKRKVSVPAGAVVVHGHPETTSYQGSVLTPTLTDSLSEGEWGDVDSLTKAVPAPTVTVLGKARVGVHELINGQFQFRMLQGTMTREEARQIQENMNRQQERYDREFGGRPC
jgi:hypothetical protein